MAVFSASGSLHSALGALCAVGVAFAPTAWAAPLSGSFSSPVGAIAIKETPDGNVTGKITDAKNPCSFAKGTVVLSGIRLDESVAGIFTGCKVGDGCAGPLDGDAILLITKSGALLSGAVHLEAPGCKTPLAGDSLTLRKAGNKAAAPPPPPAAGDRTRAEALAKEAQPLIMSGDAEEARKKCQESVKVDRTFSQGYTCIGISYFLRDRYDEALEEYKRALEADPSNHDVYYNIACIYAVQNKTEDSLEYLKLSVLNGYIDLKTLNTDSDLKNLHGNPVFEKLKLGQFD